MNATVSTNKLLRLSDAELSAADIIRLWSQAYGGDAGLTLTQLLEYLDANLQPGELVTQYAAPSATGFSVTVSEPDTWLILTPQAGYAAGTLVLPNGEDRKKVLVNCTQSVTALTITPATGETVAGAPTGLSANDFFRLRFDGVVKSWYRVG